MYDPPNDSISADPAGKIVDTPVAAISDDIDIPNEQRQCPDFKDIIEYLETGTLTENDVAARRIVLDSEQYTVIDNTLYHLHTPRQKRKDQVSSVVRQLCLQRRLRDEVTKTSHDNNGHIGFDKLYEAIRVKYFWPRMYADLSEYVLSVSRPQKGSVRVLICRRCVFSLAFRLHGDAPTLKWFSLHHCCHRQHLPFFRNASHQNLRCR